MINQKADSLTESTTPCVFVVIFPQLGGNSASQLSAKMKCKFALMLACNSLFIRGWRVVVGYRAFQLVIRNDVSFAR